MLRWFVLIVFMTVFLMPTSASQARHWRNAPTVCGLKAKSLQVGGMSRSYLICAPRGAVNSPLLIVLHGGGGSGKGVSNSTGFHKIADREGFDVIYPDGIDGRWNVGDRYNNGVRAHDVDFLAKLIANHSRGAATFVVGHSRGGMMAFRFACEGGVQAVAAVSTTFTLETCDQDPGAVLQIHGWFDNSIPWPDGGGRKGWPSPLDGVSYLAKVNGCAPDATRAMDDDAARWTFDGCIEPTEYVLIDGGHAWPGSGRRGAADWPATRKVWAFFRGQ